MLGAFFGLIVAIGFGARRIELLKEWVGAPAWIAEHGAALELAYSGAAATVGGVVFLTVGAALAAVAAATGVAVFNSLVCIGYATTTSTPNEARKTYEGQET